jgi:hypothetical protein
MPKKNPKPIEEPDGSEKLSSSKLAIPVKEMPVTWPLIVTLSQTESIPERYRDKPGDILATMMLAKEFGIGEFEALLEIYMVNGKPSLSGKLLAALIWRAGHQLICTTGEKKATVKSVRRLHDGTMMDMPDVSFSLEEAKQANLADAGKDNWDEYPKAMLAWRAITLAARVNFPDVVSAISYSFDELGGSDLVMAEAEKNVIEILDAEYVEEIEDATPRTNE